MRLEKEDEAGFAAASNTMVPTIAKTPYEATSLLR